MHDGTCLSSEVQVKQSEDVFLDAGTKSYDTIQYNKNIYVAHSVECRVESGGAVSVWAQVAIHCRCLER